MMRDYEEGDTVVCIRSPREMPVRMGPPPFWIRVGESYVVSRVKPTDWPERGRIEDVELVGCERWWWAAQYFRKVRPIEEPKRMVRVTDRELEDV